MPGRSGPAQDAPRRRAGLAPWLLFGGPGLVVVASIATWVIAARSDDGVVSNDYYRLGLLVNRRIAATPSTELPPKHATLVAAADGRLSLSVDAGSSAALPAASWTLTIVDPAVQGAGRATRVTLEPDAGTWRGTLPVLSPGRKVVTLASARWQFPVTVLAGGEWTALEFGAAGPRT